MWDRLCRTTQTISYSRSTPQPIVPGRHKLNSPSRLHLTAGQRPSPSCQGDTSLPRHPDYMLQQDDAPAHRARETQANLTIQATSYSRTTPQPIVPERHKLTSPSRLHLTAGQRPSPSCQEDMPSRLHLTAGRRPSPSCQGDTSIAPPSSQDRFGNKGLLFGFIGMTTVFFHQEQQQQQQ
ncbi:hypothetical protein PoB_002831900 [Plakobranchus ocellatus]|uniref:Uncharacterized protein n=1 Tax=Plakobranchus ocellatus TaxID=259542 RepID=A0AAV4A6F6_9GAST|nr:hypothetical protein PoB_002831900 [Plakobranchus ocellatus]